MRAAQFACQVVQGNCAVCHPLDKTRCMACSAPFAVTMDGTCGAPPTPAACSGGCAAAGMLSQCLA